ncbi:glycosyltransferase family 31 protein [Dothistroma septosporum NZE10]|uniref:Glycosyltransferase family 31 protein n=1 Tax=Dothistroma septosporum (strain NZE10 / CBS 128990) TaxID=675120 RepID=N1PVJ7_DOTSN|nr:glycosyltransferase family 31 protein [Dothistroma septosporum NZE10]
MSAQRPCQLLPGASDTVVVVKTSAAELNDRLPIHLETTFSCYPKYLIFSDWAESFRGHSVRDALSLVSPVIRSSHQDFDLWRRLQEGGPDVLDDEEIWHSERTTQNLDKWKILPMISQTFAEYPDMKWYVFLPTNTFVFRSSLLVWLRRLDSTDRHYIMAFRNRSGTAEPGSGFILSEPSMKLVSQHLKGQFSEWETMVGKLSSTDAVLDEALNSAGVHPTIVSPMLGAHSPGSLDLDEQSNGERRWCLPVVSYRGVSSSGVAELWKFEQEWLREKPDEVIRGSDVFTQFIKPRLVIRSGRVDDWDNYSSVDPMRSLQAASVDDCLHACIGDNECVQYSFVDDTCHLSAIPKLGDAAIGIGYIRNNHITAQRRSRRRAARYGARRATTNILVYPPASEEKEFLRPERRGDVAEILMREVGGLQKKKSRRGEM